MIVYLDMDGVITNFEKAVRALGEEPAQGLIDDATEIQKQAMYDAIEDAGEGFWSQMQWTDDGRDLWELVKPHRPVLLSSPGLFSFAKSGKQLWVKNNVPGTPIFFSNQKSEYLDPYEKCVLIDDNKINIEAWEKCGGIGILHTNTENTEKQFLELLWESPRLNPSDKYWN